METRATVCPLDCPDACSLDVRVEEGRITAIGGAKDRNHVTGGFICSKVRDFDRRVYHDTRLDTPLIREAGSTKGDAKFRGASWDEALDLVAERMRAARETHGGEAILPYHYGGSNGVLTDEALDSVLFSRLGASKLLKTLCAQPTGVAAQGLYGRMLGIAFDDYVHAELIVVWGANPHASNIHLAPFVKKAQTGGAKLVVVDPRRTKLAKAADLHLAPRPGTDVALALAVSRWLFENDRADREFLREHAVGVEEFARRASHWTVQRACEVTDVPAAEIEAFARMYADADPALLRCGWGLERNRNGGSAAAAVLALPAIAGKFGKRAGGYTMSSAGAFPAKVWNGIEPSSARSVDMSKLGAALLELRDPPIDVMFVYNANPLATVPDQERVRKGLERTDLFTVVFDQVMTDTARYADVVLPATTFLEHTELVRGYGALVLQTGKPTIDPVGEARPNYAVFADLARRLDVWREDDIEAPDAMIRHAMAPEFVRAMETDGFALPQVGDHPIQFGDVFPNTSDRKVHLVPPTLDAQAPFGLYHFQPDPATDAHPLALISPATERTISSTLGELYTDRCLLRIHPDDACARGIENDSAIRVYNDLGEVRTAAKLDDDLRPGTVLMPKGIWSHNTDNGRTSNALCPATSADLGLGACFNDARVEVEPV